MDGLSILDLCCGDGSSTQALFNTLNATKTKVKELVGYDISPHQIDSANKVNKNKSLTFAVMDAEKLEEEQRYDLIISFFGLHRLERIDEVVPRLHRALKADGRIVFLVPLEKDALYQLRVEPFIDYFAPEISQEHDNQFQFIERILFWQGKRRLAPLKPDGLLDVQAEASLQSAITDGFIGFFKPKTFLPTELADEKPSLKR